MGRGEIFVFSADFWFARSYCWSLQYNTRCRSSERDKTAALRQADWFKLIRDQRQAYREQRRGRIRKSVNINTDMVITTTIRVPIRITGYCRLYLRRSSCLMPITRSMAINAVACKDKRSERRRLKVWKTPNELEGSLCWWPLQHWANENKQIRR